MFFFSFDKRPLNLIGVKVVHTGKCKLLSYGEGTVVGQEDKIITVQFKHATKKFEYPKAFTRTLVRKLSVSSFNVSLLLVRT